MATRLELPKGQWLDVRERLNNGHTEDRIGYAAEGVSSDGKNYRWNMARYRTATVAIFVLHWSDGILDNTRKPIGWAAGRSFSDRCDLAHKVDARIFDHIVRAIDAHETAIEDEWSAEGNATPADAAT